MKDTTDTVTADLLPTPKKRGRPATGNALSAAERKRRQRERDEARVWGSEAENDGKNVTVTGMIEQFAHAIAEGYPAIARDLAEKLIQIAETKKQDSRN